MNTHDYRLTVKVRNNRILSLIERSHSTLAEFSRATGINYEHLNSLVCMRISAKKYDGTWRLLTLNLAAALGVEPEALFTERQLEGMPNSTVIRYVNESDILSLTDSATLLLPSFEQRSDDAVFAREIASLTKRLLPRQRYVIEHFYGVNGCDRMALKEISENLGVTTARVGKILEEATLKMRTYVSRLNNEAARV